MTGWPTAAKALATLIGFASCLVAVAYAAGARSASGGDSASASAPRPPRPRILEHPANPSLSTSAAFAYGSRLAGATFQCRLDGGAWRSCGQRIVYHGLAAGPHLFRARVEAPSGALSRPARFRWTRAEPRSFDIQPQASGLEPLYPGAPPQLLPLRLHNPNPAPILVTALRVSLAAEPAGCSSSNFTLIPSNASPARPLRIPAGGSATVPTPTVTAPAIALLDLPVSQDACQRAALSLAFSGEAHG